jgi:nitrous oxidase accessory protein NosD
MRRTILLLATVALTLLVASGVALAVGIGTAAADSSVVGPGESIQKAINAAHSGDTIIVRGVHREDVVITKNGIKLRGDDATLKPPARADSPCSKAVGPEGICILGDVDFEAGALTGPRVKDVSVSGFTIQGFDEAAIEASGASNATITGNRAVGSGETGIGNFLSVGTKILANVTRGPGGTGIGLAEAKNTKVLGNDLSGHSFVGIFVSYGSQQGLISANRVHDNNCAGMIFAAEPPGPPADFEVKGNTVKDNRGECGLGIGLFGAREIEIAGNNVSGNIPDGQNSLSGGVVVAGYKGVAPRNNTVVANNFGRNKPDIRWKGTGTGNVFGPNNCNTSVPSRLCN